MCLVSPWIDSFYVPVLCTLKVIKNTGIKVLGLRKAAKTRSDKTPRQKDQLFQFKMFHSDIYVYFSKMSTHFTSLVQLWQLLRQFWSVARQKRDLLLPLRHILFLPFIFQLQFLLSIVIDYIHQTRLGGQLCLPHNSWFGCMRQLTFTLAACKKTLCCYKGSYRSSLSFIAFGQTHNRLTSNVWIVLRTHHLLKHYPHHSRPLTCSWIKQGQGWLTFMEPIHLQTAYSACEVVIVVPSYKFFSGPFQLLQTPYYQKWQFGCTMSLGHWIL